MHNLKYSGSFLRILTYVFLAFLYLFFLHFSAPLGIGWREWHEIRVINALTNILDNFVFLKYGITSWHDYSDNYLDIINGKKSIYLIGAFNYLHYLPFAYFGGIQFIKIIGPIIDNSLIVFTSVLVAEINIILSPASP